MCSPAEGQPACAKCSAGCGHKGALARCRRASPAADGDCWEQASRWLPAFYPAGADLGGRGSLPWFASYWLPSQAAGSAFWAKRTVLGSWALLRRSGVCSSSGGGDSWQLGDAGANSTLAALRGYVSGADDWRSGELAYAAGVPRPHRRTWQWAGLWSLAGGGSEGSAADRPPRLSVALVPVQLLFFAAVLYFFYSAVSTAQAAPSQTAATRPAAVLQPGVRPSG